MDTSTKEEHRERVERKREVQERHAPEAPMPPRDVGLRSQGETAAPLRDPDDKRPEPPRPYGRRAPPTRYDAMAISGHERLPGWSDSGSNPPAPTRTALVGPPRSLAHIQQSTAAPDHERSDPAGPHRSASSRSENVRGDEERRDDDPSGSRSLTRGRQQSDALEM